MEQASISVYRNCTQVSLLECLQGGVVFHGNLEKISHVHCKAYGKDKHVWWEGSYGHDSLNQCSTSCHMSVSVGLGACGVASVFFGSMFVPIRKHDAADGMFAQWVMSVAILFVGFLIFCLQGFPGFYPLAMVGGVFWTI
ncbi:unnamed protein product, partial [Strongylus vulgaris]